MTEWIAVTGGCGYIGSHIALEIKEYTNYKVLIIDKAASQLPHTHWLADELINDDIISIQSFGAMVTLKPKAIIHCAGTSLVGPSIKNPSDYYINNILKTNALLEFMRKENLNNIIFSSSAAVYGNNQDLLTEDTPKNPINPYGRSKSVIEDMLIDYGNAYGINSICFRYFNAAGADPDSRIGQIKNSTHLIARIMESIINQTELQIYGNDYKTPDGTCLRDYVHVCDVAKAHVGVINKFDNNRINEIYNLGSGKIYSVNKILGIVEKVINQGPAYQYIDRREGDPDRLIAGNQKARTYLDWQIDYTIEDIIKHAWDWYNSEIYKGMK